METVLTYGPASELEEIILSSGVERGDRDCPNLQLLQGMNGVYVTLLYHHYIDMITAPRGSLVVVIENCDPKKCFVHNILEALACESRGSQFWASAHRISRLFFCR